MGLVLEVCFLPALALAQQSIPFPPPGRLVDFPVREPAWYSGDTHEHVQLCDDTLLSLEDVLARMESEQLNLCNVLIWDRPSTPFQALVCRVTGEPDPLSTDRRVLQYGIETSGLDCAKWGHLIALGTGPDRARIAAGTVALGACADMAGLGFGCPDQGDGTGSIDGPVARYFLAEPGVVTGYAHTLWPVGLYHPLGFDWQTELVDTGFTTDARVLDPGQHLAVPDLDQLGLDPHTLHEGGGLRAFLPLLGAVDAVLANVQFVETVYLNTSPPVAVTPPSSWTGLYYKLLSAGVRVGLSGGSDRACTSAFLSEHPRTYVRLDELSYPAWIQGLAAGRTTIGVPGVRVDLEAGGAGVGSEVDVSSSSAVPILADVVSTTPLNDAVELVVNGEVREQFPVNLPAGGSASFQFSDLVLTESAWVAVRLGSLRAHTAAIWVVVDDRPIADAASAEYWMLWCDIVTKTTLDHPELTVFDCQEGEALAAIEDARAAFRALRDVDGFDPAWGVERRGESTPACAGPIAIGTTGPVVSGQPFRVTCVHAPPSAQGELVVSKRAQPAGPCFDGTRLFVSQQPADLIGVYFASSTPGGYAEVDVPAPPVGVSEVHLQFRWTNPPGCASRPCSGSAKRSASDALRALVH